MGLFILELIATAALALSGAVLGLRKRLDIFGVSVLALVAGLAGGIIRDIILGLTPPLAFTSPIYAAVALATAILAYIILRRVVQCNRCVFERIYLISDAIGLGIFTATGVVTAFNAGFSGNIFLLVLVGIVTGVSGGVLRDLLAFERPVLIFKRLYALAPLVGAVLCVLLILSGVGQTVAIIASAVVAFLVRLLSFCGDCFARRGNDCDCDD